MPGTNLGKSIGKAAILSTQNWRSGISGQYLIHFEKALEENSMVDSIPLSKYAYKNTRLLDVLRGQKNVYSLPESLTDVINKLGRSFGLSDQPYQLPSIIRYKVRSHEQIFLFAGQIYEIRLLDNINWKDKKIIVYIGDAWEPKFDRLNKLINQYDIDLVFTSFRKPANHIIKNGHKGFWLPQAINPKIWKDYGSQKKYKLIQFGRKSPILHKFGKKNYGENNYIHGYIEGNINLAKHINMSEYTLVSPQKRQFPDKTGDVSPVTLRYYQAMACKSMPAGFKPEEFDHIFSDDIYFLKYEDEEQFTNSIEYFEDNKDEYWELVNRNYKLIMSNHTWKDRVKSMSKILEREIQI